MIEVLENAGYPYSAYARLGGSNNPYKYCLISDMKRSKVNADYLSQDRHDHATGWSGVIHAKAVGSVHRVDDGSIPGMVRTHVSELAPGDVYLQNAVFVSHPSSANTATVAVTGLDNVAYCTYIETKSASQIKMHNLAIRFSQRNGKIYQHACQHTITCKGIGMQQVSWVNGKGTSTGCPTPGISLSGVGSFEEGIALILLTLHERVTTNATESSAISTKKVYYCTLPKGAPGTYRTNGEIIRLVRKDLLRFAELAHEQQSINRQTLQAQSFDSINRFDGNMLALLGDLRHIGTGSFEVLINMLESAKNPRKLAKAWLSARYGDRLTYSDLKSLFAGFSRTAWRRSRHAKYLLGRSRKSYELITDRNGAVSVHLSTQIAVQPKDYNGVMTQIRKAYEWDYYPSLANVWDMVPLSFVVDWFVDVSSIFEDLDRLVQARYYRVTCVLESVKAIGVSNSLRGVDLSYYDRSTGKQLSLGMSSVQLGLPSTVNIVDGISLFLM